MGPPHLALGLVVNQELYRRLPPKAMVGQHGIVGQQPIGQFAVKGRQIVNQQVLVVIHELFLEGAIEPFDMRIHFGGAWIGPPMGDAVGVEALLEVAVELGAVGREEELRRGREQGTQGLEADRGVAAGGGGGGPGEGEATVGIEEGEHVAP